MRAALLAALAVLLAGCGGSATPEAPKPEPTPFKRQSILAEHRVVAFYGHPDDRALGVLGIGSPRTAARRLVRQARAYERKGRPVLPAMELLAAVATYDAGADGMYRRHTRDAVIRRYLRAAREVGAKLVLDIQAGAADFFAETVRLEKWLAEPDVGLALDPEWRVPQGVAPGKVIGSVSAREVNAASAWLDMLCQRKRLPQKLFVIHQFTADMIPDEERLKPRECLDIVLNADGFGTPEVKVAKYVAFTRGPGDFFDGLKLFYDEDTRLMSPREVLRLRPAPDFVVYE